MRYETKELLKVYKEHGKIIIGLDFDNTIFALKNELEGGCEAVREVVIETQDNATICLYTVASDQELKYKAHIARDYGINISYINESPVKIGNGDKPYFNILLDDKAGLSEALGILIEFNKNLNK
jgi:hypothetical protein